MAAPTRTRVECEVSTSDSIISLLHGLGGPVTVTAYDAEGVRIGYELASEISDDEVEVIVVPGTVARLVVELDPDDE